MPEIIESSEKGICVIQINPENQHNFFSPALEDSLKDALKRADADDSIQAVVVYGGAGRSFSGGNNFNEFKNLFGYQGVDEWIERAIDLYVTVLLLQKPSVAAIGGGAIGMGFQFAMMFDWRIMSRQAKLYMQNLQYGIGCTAGATILEHIGTWNTMRDIIYRGERISADQALHHGLVNDVADDSSLLESAIVAAIALAAYPQAAFRNTKKVVNNGFLDKLIGSSEMCKQVHKTTFHERGISLPFQKMLRERDADISLRFTAI